MPPRLLALSPIFSADFHAVVPEQHKKKAHPYLKTVGGDDAADKTQDKDKDARRGGDKDEDKIWRLATCGGDKYVRVRRWA